MLVVWKWRKHLVCRWCQCGGESLLDDDSTPNTLDTCLAWFYIIHFCAYGGMTRRSLYIFKVDRAVSLVPHFRAGLSCLWPGKRGLNAFLASSLHSSSCCHRGRRSQLVTRHLSNRIKIPKPRPEASCLQRRRSGRTVKLVVMLCMNKRVVAGE
jgi:predicted amidophosphoribosyltransferase